MYNIPLITDVPPSDRPRGNPHFWSLRPAQNINYGVACVVRNKQLTQARVWLSFCVVSPIIPSQEHIRRKNWYVLDEPLDCPRFNQQNIPVRVLGQPIGQHAPRRPRSHDNEVILLQIDLSCNNLQLVKLSLWQLWASSLSIFMSETCLISFSKNGANLSNSC